MGKKSCPNNLLVPANLFCYLPSICCGLHGRTVVTVATERFTGCQSPVPAFSQVNRHLLVNPARCQLQMAPMTPFDTIIWPNFPKGNRPMTDHRDQLLVRTGTLKCLAKPNPAAIPSDDLLLPKNPANEPILVNCTNEVIENESKLPGSQRPL